MMKIFIKFTNRIRHPRVTFNLLATGVLLALVPTVIKGIALPGVVISYGMGVLLILMALFRQNISVSMMKNDPQVKENEEITYLFGDSRIRALRDGREEDMGYYKNVYRVWEDERIYYVGMNEEDLLILPKDEFIEGDQESFREFILDKSGADYRWVPTGLVNRSKEFGRKIRGHMTQMRIDAQEQNKKR
nr:YcxB family protein [uncultured Merdimonas sp.]